MDQDRTSCGGTRDTRRQPLRVPPAESRLTNAPQSIEEVALAHNCNLSLRERLPYLPTTSASEPPRIEDTRSAVTLFFDPSSDRNLSAGLQQQCTAQASCKCSAVGALTCHHGVIPSSLCRPLFATISLIQRASRPSTNACIQTDKRTPPAIHLQTQSHMCVRSHPLHSADRSSTDRTASLLTPANETAGGRSRKGFSGIWRGKRPTRAS